MPRTSKKKPLSRKQKLLGAVKKPILGIRRRLSSFTSRRPHRSFQMTKRRNYRRSLKLPGYFAFNLHVNKTLWKYKKVFIWLTVTYLVLTVALVGIGSQETYNALVTALKDTGTELFSGSFGQIGQAALLFASIGSLGLNSGLSDIQQIYVVGLALLVWLTTVWLLRGLLAGHKLKMRDGLYSAGSPIIATLLVAVVFALQLLPIGLAVIGYSAAEASGLLDGGVAAMLFWFSAALLAVMSLYWIASSFFALIIVTLPGMYPMQALKTAGDMVVGRRLRILLRILWMAGSVIAAGAIVMIPIILINSGLNQLWSFTSSVPIVPFALLLFSVTAFIWTASYVYLLYRKVVDDDAKPA